MRARDAKGRFSGICVGDSYGEAFFALPMTPGRHKLVCVAADGRTVTVSFDVEAK